MRPLAGASGKSAPSAGSGREAASSGADPVTTVDALVAAGVEARLSGDHDTAEALFREVLSLDLTEPLAVRHLGAILAERGEIEAAIELFESALERVGLPPAATVGFYNNYANALRRAGRYPLAERLLHEIVSIAPAEWQPWHNLGKTLRDLGRLDEAAAAMEHAVTLEPGFGPNHGVLGEILFRLGDPAGALASLQRCVDLGWRSDPDVWSAIGVSQRLLGRLDDACEALREALRLVGSTPAAHRILGVVLSQLGRFDEAIAQFDASLALDSDDPISHVERAFGLLAAGRLSEGWDEWEYGFESGQRGADLAAGVPRWTLADLDARVLVYREQGLGDELMFASCYPDIIEVAREVVIECDPRLISLFARSFPEADVHGRPLEASVRTTVYGCERAIPAGSLPRIFRPTLAAFPDRPAVIEPDPDRVAAWHQRLGTIGRPPYVGIAWRSRLMTVDRRRSYTRLDDWGEVFAVPRVTWVNLQYDECEPELLDAEERFGVRLHRWEWLDLMNDLDEAAALTAALDLVVSPRSAVSMLAGALGVDTIAFANRHSWADLGTTDRLPWMPAVRMMYREPNAEWAPVLSDAARTIVGLAERATG
jgi:Flp pilus assembly protein TadD